jgi:glycerophosphoryl diester phosphodiesterase
LLSSLDRWLAPAPSWRRVYWLRDDQNAHRTYAHRGLHGGGIVENSTGAFTAAYAARFGIECDVQLTADDQAVVFHDWDLDRLTSESGAVAERNLAEVAQIALRGSEELIPTLRDLLKLIAGGVDLLIEIKSRADQSPETLCRAVARDLEGYGGEVGVMSFDPRVGAWFARNAPDITRGLVISEANAKTIGGAIKRHLALARARPDFLAYDIRDLPSAFAAAQRARGLPVLAWTVSTEALRRLAEKHADAAIAEAEGLAPAPGNP